MRNVIHHHVLQRHLYFAFSKANRLASHLLTSFCLPCSRHLAVTWSGFCLSRAGLALQSWSSKLSPVFSESVFAYCFFQLPQAQKAVNPVKCFVYVIEF